MNVSFERIFRAPYSMPNGLQRTDEGLWVVDQISDRVALVEMEQSSGQRSYGITRMLREIATESSNASGLAYGDGSLWLAANGSAELWRTQRATDAKHGEILRVDPTTGATQARYDLPGLGGTHGIEYDRFDPGHLWLTTLKDQTITKVRIADWGIEAVLPLPYERAHGVVRVVDGLWVVFTSDRCIVKLDIVDGAVLAEIVVPAEMPEPHGLCADGHDLLYCDATSGWIVRIALGSGQ